MSPEDKQVYMCVYCIYICNYRYVCVYVYTWWAPTLVEEEDGPQSGWVGRYEYYIYICIYISIGNK